MFAIPLQVVDVMRDFKPNWFVAGGWAIDLFLGKETRAHSDIEIAVFRKDQAALHNYFKSWNLQKTVNGKLVVWHQEEWLTLPTHEIHCFKETAKPPKIEILLNESNETEWIYRRNQQIRRSLAKIGLRSIEGITFLCPEIVLLYKSKSPKPKDEQDFQAVVGHLKLERKQWLKYAIGICDPKHRWLESL
ncbi:MAG TPA: hypothetical protein VGP58_04335 [Pyrinomonadaceae bacterium]|nr:hypothetical protein [Pyrinomonadaceae bacterium]